MGLDAGTVLKRPVVCPHCNEEYYFTLRAISDNSELRCHGCGGSICLRDSVYEPLINNVRAILETIHSAQSAASFISAHPIVAL
jgi:transcription elongation factor Elf1